MGWLSKSKMKNSSQQMKRLFSCGDTISMLFGRWLTNDKWLFEETDRKSTEAEHSLSHISHISNSVRLK